MSISVSRPEIFALRSRVEEAFGESPSTHNAFIALVDSIGDKIREHISESTLERLWGYSTRGTEAISVHTLDVLARYAGERSWKDFCTGLKLSSPVESEEFSGETIDSATLAPGSMLLLGWLPDRQVKVEHRGNGRFIVRESVNSSLQPGDSFSCLQIQKGRPFYLDHFRRSGSITETRYVAGERSGLTTVELLPA